MTRHFLTRLFDLAARAFLAGLVLAFASASAAPDVREGSLKKCWEHPFAGIAGKTLASDNQLIFFASEAGSVQTLDASNGKTVWSAELGGEIASNIIISGDALFLVSNTGGVPGVNSEKSTIRSLSKLTGVTNWTATLPYSDEFYLGRSDSRLLAVGEGGTITSLLENVGAALWSKSLPARMTARPAFENGKIAVGTDKKKLVVLASADGRSLMEVALDSPVSAVAFVNGKSLIAGDERGNAALINLESGGKTWNFKSGAAIAHATNTKHGVLIHSLDNFVYLLSAYDGDAVWKRRLPGRLASGVLVGEDFGLAMINGEKSAYLIDLNNGRIVDLITVTDDGFLSQIPVAIGGSRIIVATPRGIESHGLGSCPTK